MFKPQRRKGGVPFEISCGSGPVSQSDPQFPPIHSISVSMVVSIDHFQDVVVKIEKFVKSGRQVSKLVHKQALQVQITRVFSAKDQISPFG